MALKANHPTLYSQVSTWFKNAAAQNFPGIDVSYDQRLEKGHHRREIRQVWSVPVTAIPNLYQPRHGGPNFKALSWLFECVISGTKLLAKFSFI